MSEGLPLESGKAIFCAVAKFFRPAAKSEKKIFLYFIKLKMELIPSHKMKCPKSAYFTNYCVSVR